MSHPPAHLASLPLDQLTGPILEGLLNTLEPEGRHLEYKEVGSGTPGGVAKSVASFANTYGGLVLVGVPEAKGGVPDLGALKASSGVGADVRRDVERSIASRLDPPLDPDIEVVTVLGVRVMIIRVVPSVDRPVLCSGVAYYRHGEQDVPMPREMVRAMFAEARGAPQPSVRGLGSLHPATSVTSPLRELSPGHEPLMLRCAAAGSLWPVDQDQVITGRRHQVALEQAAAAALRDAVGAYGLHLGANTLPVFGHATPSDVYTVSTGAGTFLDDEWRSAAHARLIYGPRSSWPGITAIVDFALNQHADARRRYLDEHGAVDDSQLVPRRLALDELAVLLSTLAGAARAMLNATSELLPHGFVRVPVGPYWWVTGPLDEAIELDDRFGRLATAASLGSSWLLEPPRDGEPDLSAIDRGFRIALRNTGFLTDDTILFGAD